MRVLEASPLKMAGAKFEVQQALLGLRRLIERGGIRPTTRVILEGAVKALEGESESVSAGEAPAPQLSPSLYSARSAAPK